MSYIAKPKVAHPGSPRNKLGLTSRDYEGTVSTLCAGCGHDSITAAIIQAVFELGIAPHMLAKMSGIGCSSKTPAYFVSQSHGFNSVHGRMPSVTTGANAANQDLLYIGVSGDGDSLSIGMGQFAHVIRRNLNMCYIIENNGVYGLTKGQFSASADIGTVAKKGPAERTDADRSGAAPRSASARLTSRAAFRVTRSRWCRSSRAALVHKGFSLLDIISPCVTFNDHEGSTKSYAHTREHYHHVIDTDFVPPAAEIRAAYQEGEAMPVELHDGSKIVFRKVDKAYDPTSRAAAFSFLRSSVRAGEIITGLLYIDEEMGDMHDLSGSVDRPLSKIPYEELNPGKANLAQLMNRYR